MSDIAATPEAGSPAAASLPADAGDATGAPAAPAEDAALEAAWAKLHPQERVDRGEGGQFQSRDGGQSDPPLGQQAEGEGQGAASAAADVPLPANWTGLDAEWGLIPAAARAKIAEHQQRQHAQMSDLGRKVAVFEPMTQVASEFAEYFNGNLTLPGADGKPVKITPAEGVRYLAGIQRAMDSKPIETLLSIADTYKVRDQLMAALGGQAGQGQQPQGDQQITALKSEIEQLKNVIRQSSDPKLIEQVVDRKNADAEQTRMVSRLMDPNGSRPLASQIEADTLAFFIGKAWKALGDNATHEQVFDHAYNAAIEADPALRAKSEAVKTAAADKAAKAEGAKRGTSVNLKSNATGKPHKLSDDEAMEEVWRKHGLN